MSEKLKIEIVPDSDGVVREVGDVLSAAQAAGWSDDPGTGKAVMLPGANGRPGYEVPNPMSFAPPIGWEPTPPIEQLIRDRVKLEYDRLKGEDEIDDIIDAEDFDVPDELPPLETIYEVIAMEPEAPRLPPEEPLEKRVSRHLDEEEALTRARLERKRNREAALKKQSQEAAELYGDDAPVDPPRSERAP